ncbi:hypothetical protein SHTS_02535, partial [Staphylococcus haemolyticus]
NRINLYDQTLYSVSENKANGVFFSLDGNSINENTLIQNYGQPNYYSPTSAWGEVYMYKIGNKNVRFYIDNGYVNKCQIMSE